MKHISSFLYFSKLLIIGSWVSCLWVSNLYAQDTPDVLPIDGQKDMTLLDDISVTPFIPKGYNPTPKKFSEKIRNIFLGRKFKMASFQRDSLYHQLQRSNNEKEYLINTYTQDTTERNFRYEQLANKERNAAEALSKCENTARTQRKNYLDLSLSYDKLSSSYREITANLEKCEINNKTNREQYLNLKSNYKNLNAHYEQFKDSSSSVHNELHTALKDQEQARKEAQERAHNLERLLYTRDSAANALKNALKNTLLSFDPNQLSVSLKKGRVYVSFSERFLFQSGSAEITNPEAHKAIKVLADIIRENPKLDVLIEGHTDSIPIKTARYKDNWDLSVDRAVAVVRLLSTTPNVDPSRITAAGRASYVPKASNQTPEGRAQNRRTELILTPNLQDLYDLIEDPAQDEYN